MTKAGLPHSDILVCESSPFLLFACLSTTPPFMLFLNRHRCSTTAQILSFTPNLFLGILSAVCVLLVALSARAQAPDTLRIPFNRSEITQSSIILRQDALYRWTVRGRAQVGVFGQSSLTADARFATNNLGLPQLPVQPTRLPLDENTAVQPLCTSLQETSPASSPCNIYFLTNARRGASNLALDPAFRLTDAAQMKQYAFRPDDDTFRASSVYQAIVRGANDFVKALFVDGFGFPNNRSYMDNPSDTALVLTIERLSPELLLTAEPNFNITGRLPVRVLNDISPASTFRDTTIDFGSVQVNTPPVQTRRIVLRNRGAEALRILRIEAPMLNPAFTVVSSAGALGNPILLGAMSDSITLSCTFFAREAREYTQEIRIITNDPANPIFTLRLQGKGASGTLSPVQPMDFGNVYVGTTSPVLTRAFSRTNFLEAFAIDSVQLPDPSSGFTVIGLAPQSYPVGPDPRFTPSASFSPKNIGDVADSAVLRGNNLVDYKIFLTGRGVRADFTFLRQGTPLVERVLDFGTHVSGASSTQTITIQNTGNLPLNIAVNLTSSTNSRPSDVGEFSIVSAPNALGEITGTTQNFILRYTANPQNPDGRKEAVFEINIRDGNNGAALTPQRFTLVARRLPNVITPSRTDVRFDSVYVGSEARDTILVSNTSRFLGTILRQAPPRLPFNADTVRSPRTFLPANSAVVNLTFAPTRIGMHEDSLTLASRVDSTGAQEISRVAVRGVGVRQQCPLIRLTSDSSANTNTTINTVSTLVNGKTRTYTADIGCVRVGERRDIRCFFRNDGNIPFRAFDRFVRLEPAQTRDFSVVNPFQIVRSLLPNEQDNSLQIRFTPTVRGPQEMHYTIRSDIRQNIGGRVRVPTAPDSTDDITIIIRGEGITPSIEAAQSVDFGEVTFDATGGTGCNSTQRAIPFTNSSAIACGTFTRLSNPRLANANATPFSIRSGSTDLIVRTGSSAGTIQVEFKPTRQGDFQDELIVNTDAPPPRDVLRIRLTGRSIPLPNVVMSIASNHTARPGSLISIPVLVTASTIGNINANVGALRLTNRAEFQLKYNRTLLEFDGVNTDGTASAGGRDSVRVDTSNRREPTVFVRISAPQNENFRPTETLVNLRFRAYLGNDTATVLTLSGVSFGEPLCPKINFRKEADVRHGRFQLDGVCDLVWKAALMTQKPLVMADVSPNPIVGGQGKMRFLVNEAATITITMRDALGVNSVRTLVQERSVDAGLYEETLPLENLPTGIYFCEILAIAATTNSVYREVKKFVVVK
ncbi:MAG: T9SS C-terminal target domain-containing protein [Candidatus Kapaibacterium sp.]|nr:MAG: T9SS C-terminal target domain-containing protein [Candidatus Kapabacteria bacterium]